MQMHCGPKRSGTVHEISSSTPAFVEPLRLLVWRLPLLFWLARARLAMPRVRYVRVQVPLWSPPARLLRGFWAKMTIVC